MESVICVNKNNGIIYGCSVNNSGEKCQTEINKIWKWLRRVKGKKQLKHFLESEFCSKIHRIKICIRQKNHKTYYQSSSLKYVIVDCHY